MGADRSHGLSNSPCGVHQAQCRPEGGTHCCTHSLHFLTQSRVGSKDQTGFEGKRCSTGPQANTQCSQADSHSLLWVPSICDPLLLPLPPPQTPALQPGGSLRARTHLLHPVYLVPQLCGRRQELTSHVLSASTSGAGSFIVICSEPQRCFTQQAQTLPFN